MSSTIGCTPERSSQDAWFEEFFSSEPTLDLRGDELTFTANESTLIFLDREVANPDRSLAGRVWTIDTIIDGPAATNFPEIDAQRLTLTNGDVGLGATTD